MLCTDEIGFAFGTEGEGDYSRTEIGGSRLSELAVLASSKKKKERTGRCRCLYPVATGPLQQSMRPAAHPKSCRVRVFLRAEAAKVSDRPSIS